jgi:hypothetical protein
MQALTGSDASPSIGELVEAARQGLDGVVPAGDGIAALDAFLRERLGYMLQQRGAPIGHVRAVVGARALAICGLPT